MVRLICAQFFSDQGIPTGRRCGIWRGWVELGDEGNPRENNDNFCPREHRKLIVPAQKISPWNKNIKRNITMKITSRNECGGSEKKEGFS